MQLQLALCAALATLFPQDEDTLKSPQTPAGAQTPSLASEFAAWRVDALTRDDGPSCLESLVELISRAEDALRRAPSEEGAVELLGTLYRTELSEVEKRRDHGTLQERLFVRLEIALTKSPSDVERAFARAASLGVEPALVRRVFERTAAASQRAGRPTESPGEELIAAAIQDALEAGDRDFVLQLGTSAVAPLVELSLSIDGSPVSSAEADPFELLAQLSPAAALDVALQHAQGDDVLRKSRVIQAFGDVSPFEARSTWVEASAGRFKLARPEWSGIVTGLLNEPGVPFVHVERFLREFMSRDCEPEGYAPLFASWFERNWPNERPVREAVARAATTLLQSDEPRLQERGASMLVLTSDASAALKFAGSSDRALRESVAKVFAPRSVSTLTAAGTVEAVKTLPTINDELRSGLDTFVRAAQDDSSGAAISGASLSAHQSNAVIVTPELFRKWLEILPAGENSWFEELILHVEHLAPLERVALYPQLAKWISTGTDSDEAAARARTERRIVVMLRAASDVGGADELLEAVRACESHGLAGAAGTALKNVLPELFAAHPEAASPVLDWLAKSASLAAWSEIVEVSRNENGVVRHEPFLAQLPPDDQLMVIRTLWSKGYDRFDWFDESEVALDRVHWLQLVDDKNLSAPGRSWAISCLCGTKGPALDPASRPALVLARGIAAIGECPVSSRELTEAGADAALVLEALLEDKEVNDETLLNFYVALDGLDPGLADRVHRRFPSDTWSEHQASPLLSSLVRGLTMRKLGALNNELLRANIAGSMLQRTLIESIVFARTRVHLSVAGEVLKAKYFPGDRTRLQVVQYVESFLDDEAAGMLIEAARSTRSADYRAELFAALEKVLAWQDAESRWRKGSGTAAKREQAIATLLNMLLPKATASPAARTEAVRGLAALGAVEQIPTLIDLLEDSEASVRAAAKEALDLLSRRESKK